MMPFLLLVVGGTMMHRAQMLKAGALAAEAYRCGALEGAAAADVIATEAARVHGPRVIQVGNTGEIVDVDAGPGVLAAVGDLREQWRRRSEAIAAAVVAQDPALAATVTQSAMTGPPGARVLRAAQGLRRKVRQASRVITKRRRKDGDDNKRAERKRRKAARRMMQRMSDEFQPVRRDTLERLQLRLKALAAQDAASMQAAQGMWADVVANIGKVSEPQLVAVLERIERPEQWRRIVERRTGRALEGRTGRTRRATRPAFA
jgi:hypothetical protein